MHVRAQGKGRAAGACTAAAFLEAFVEEGVEWAHCDIAGAAGQLSRPALRLSAASAGAPAIGGV